MLEFEARAVWCRSKNELDLDPAAGVPQMRCNLKSWKQFGAQMLILLK